MTLTCDASNSRLAVDTEIAAVTDGLNGGQRQVGQPMDRVHDRDGTVGRLRLLAALGNPGLVSQWAQEDELELL